MLTLNICSDKSNQALSVITTVDPNAPIGGVFITVAKETEIGSYFSKFGVENVAESWKKIIEIFCHSSVFTQSWKFKEKEIVF